MLTLLSLSIDGFRSIAEFTTLQLNSKSITWINSPTGSGKSTIFSAITWALFGKDLKGVSDVKTWEKYRPSGYKGVCVTLSYQTNNGIFKVIRCQDFKIKLDDGCIGGNRLLLYQDGFQLGIKGKTNIQNEVEKTLGLTYSLFINSVMFGQGLKRLIQESNTDKKKIFEEVFDLNFLNVAKNLANNERSSLVNQVNDLKRQCNDLKSRSEESHDTYKELLEQEETWESNNTKKSEALSKKRLDLTKELLKAKQNIKEPVVRMIDSRISKVDKRLLEVTHKLSKAKNGTELDLGNLISRILVLLEKKKYKKVYSELSSLQKTFKDLEEYQNEKETLIERKYKLKEIKSKKKQLEDLCNTLADNICDIDKQIRDLKKEKRRILSPKYKEAWKKYRRKFKKSKKEYDSLAKELENYDWLVTSPLGNNGIKAYLFDSSLSTINEALSNYSDILGFRVSFEIDLDSTRKDFVTLIESNGVIIEYDELSGGEKSLVNLAMALAMNEALTAARGINIAFLDEVFEGISDDVLETAINLITHVFENKSLFLISHHKSLPLHKARIMQVVKQNGLSKILFN